MFVCAHEDYIGVFAGKTEKNRDALSPAFTKKSPSPAVFQKDIGRGRVDVVLIKENPCELNHLMAEFFENSA